MPAERGPGQLRVHGTVTGQRRLTVQTTATGASQECLHCGHTSLRAAELVDEDGHAVATMMRCDQCTGRHRHQGQV